MKYFGNLHSWVSRKLHKYVMFLYCFVLLILLFHVVCASALATDNVNFEALLARSLAENTVIEDIEAEIEIQNNTLEDAILKVLESDNEDDFDEVFKCGNMESIVAKSALLKSVAKEQSGLSSLLDDKCFLQLGVESSVREAYIAVLLAQNSVLTLEKNVEIISNLCIECEKKYKIGACEEEDYLYFVESLDRLNIDLGEAQTNFDLMVDNLEKEVGFDLSSDVMFDEYLLNFDNVMRDIDLDGIYLFAADNQYDYLLKLRDVEVAQSEFNELMGLFNSKYPNFLNEFTLMCESSNGKLVSAEEFGLLHEYAVAQSVEFWYKDYNLNAAIFSITVPQSFFDENIQEVSRWFEGQSDELYESYIKLEQFNQVAEVALDKMHEDIDECYAKLLQVFSEYNVAKEDFLCSKFDYDNAVNGQKIGQVGFLDLEAKRNALLFAELDLFAKNSELLTLSNELNEITGGYIDNLNGKLCINNVYLLQGLVPQEWCVVFDNTCDKFSFNCNISSNYAVDEYQLAYNGELLGDRIGINETWVQDSIVYNGTTKVDLYLYEKGVVKYRSAVDLLHFHGVLAMILPDEIAQQKSNEIGHGYLKNSNLLFSEVKIDIPDCIFTHFEVVINEKPFGVIYGDDLVIFSFLLNDKFDIKLNMYNNADFLFSLFMDSGEFNGGLLN